MESRKPGKSRKKKIAIVALCLMGAGMVVVLALPSFMVGDPETRLRTSVIPADLSGADPPAPDMKHSLKLLTLNIAHGRRDGAHQIFQKIATIRANLNDIAAVMRREEPDVVALQEADGPSIWSGNFNHVEYLAETAKIPYFVRAENVKGLKLSYGAALLSALPLEDSVSFTFAPSPPTFSKGFVVAAISLSGEPGVKIDVASVHLDFSRKSVRKSQVEEMISSLQGRARPLVIMGDFNCEWMDKESPLRMLAEKLNVKPYQPGSKDMATFPKLKRRLDWILISAGLEFITYEVLPDIMSDHFGVVSEIRVLPQPK